MSFMTPSMILIYLAALLAAASFILNAVITYSRRSRERIEQTRSAVPDTKIELQPYLTEKAAVRILTLAGGLTAFTVLLVHAVRFNLTAETIPIATISIISLGLLVLQIIRIFQISRMKKVVSFIKRLVVPNNEVRKYMDDMDSLLKRQDIVHHMVNHEPTELSHIVSFVSYPDIAGSGIFDHMDEFPCKYATDLSGDVDIKLAIMAVVKSSQGYCLQPLIINDHQMLQIMPLMYDPKKENQLTDIDNKQS